MTKTMLNDRILPAIGPILFAILCLAQPFSRGLVNVSFALLALWGLVWLAWGRLRWPAAVTPLPRAWLRALAIFLLVYLLAALAGARPGRGLASLATSAYVISALPLAWLALAHCPRLIRALPFLYGLGLIVTAVITYFEAGQCLACVRAKGSLGIIELGGVLGQLPPLMVGALAMAAPEGRRGIPKTLFFILALAASYVAIRTNCGRIAMICAPLLMAAMFAANLGKLRNLTGLLLALASLAGIFLLATNEATMDRFRDMFAGQGQSVNNTERFNYWRQGIDVFKDHPVLGIGPAAKPNLPPDMNINRRPAPYAHAHNVYLTFLAETGVVGLAAFLVLILCPARLLWPFLRSRDPLAFLWSWSAIMVLLQLALNGVTDHVYGNKVIMFLHFSVMGTALWVALGRRPEDGVPGRTMGGTFSLKF
ncbi:MAG: O-antigen ligase family protein [Deltaproteobacteria bacterium]|nr:O-antigen ligase family protein [Deltaproteobacteria bacterium]